MPKPRTNFTWIKHLGTAAKNPIAYFRYKHNKMEFIQDQHLKLNSVYTKEKELPHHYPGTEDENNYVVYPEDLSKEDKDATIVRSNINEKKFKPFNFQVKHKPEGASLGVRRGVLFVLQNNAEGNPTLRAAVKSGPLENIEPDEKGLRTQHTTLSGGDPVASAAIFDNREIIMTSGHYRPDDAAAHKLAIFGKTAGLFDRRKTDVRNSKGQLVDLRLKARIKAVNQWAKQEAAKRKQEAAKRKQEAAKRKARDRGWVSLDNPLM